MDGINKLYKPEEIQDTPFPQQDTSNLTANQSAGSGGVYGATTTQEQSFPLKRTATEVLSGVLNTQTHKILGEFTFTPSGAIQIGDYTQGVSGDVRISPNGITARNQLGSETFALDGDTGDATFAGRIQTGSIVSGLALLGDGSIEIDGINKRIVFYENNIPVIIIGSV